jgi:hypothetical protein
VVEYGVPEVPSAEYRQDRIVAILVYFHVGLEIALICVVGIFPSSIDVQCTLFATAQRGVARWHTVRSFTAVTHRSIANLLPTSRLISMIGLKSKKNPDSSLNYQHLLVELKSLDRAKRLQCIKPAHHELRAKSVRRGP